MQIDIIYVIETHGKRNMIYVHGVVFNIYLLVLNVGNGGMIEAIATKNHPSNPHSLRLAPVSRL